MCRHVHAWLKIYPWKKNWHYSLWISCGNITHWWIITIAAGAGVVHQVAAASWHPRAALHHPTTVAWYRCVKGGHVEMHTWNDMCTKNTSSIESRVWGQWDLLLKKMAPLEIWEDWSNVLVPLMSVLSKKNHKVFILKHVWFNIYREREENVHSCGWLILLLLTNQCQKPFIIFFISCCFNEIWNIC